MAKLALFYSTERPYGVLSEKPEGIELRKRLINFFQETFNSTLDGLEVPRTHFFLGEWLQRSIETGYRDQIYDLFSQNQLVEVAQHSFSHGKIFPTSEYGENNIMSPEEFDNDLRNADDVIWDCFELLPYGVQVPYGHVSDMSSMPKYLEVLSHIGYNYVSSHYRGIKNPLEALVSEESQPHTYTESGFPKLVEIPAHGLQDVIFTKEKAELFGVDLFTQEQILEHYLSIIRQGMKLNVPTPYVALSLHPWAVMEYDPEMEIHRAIIEFTIKKGIEIVTASQIADDILLA